jgi:hypothetical protein
MKTDDVLKLNKNVMCINIDNCYIDEFDDTAVA